MSVRPILVPQEGQPQEPVGVAEEWRSRTLMAFACAPVVGPFESVSERLYSRYGAPGFTRDGIRFDSNAAGLYKMATAVDRTDAYTVMLWALRLGTSSAFASYIGASYNGDGSAPYGDQIDANTGSDLRFAYNAGGSAAAIAATGQSLSTSSFEWLTATFTSGAQGLYKGLSLIASGTTAGVPSYGPNAQLVLGQADNEPARNPNILIRAAFRFNTVLSAGDRASIIADPWQVFAPRRIWVPVSAGGAVTGTLAVSNANDALSAAGSPIVAGSLARTNANDTLTAAGSPIVSGALAKTNANDTLAASGAVGSSVVGTLSTTNANDSLAAAGTTAVIGTVNVTNVPDTLSAAGSTTVVGTLARANANDTLQATGAAGTVTGSVAVMNRNDTLAASGKAGNPQPEQYAGGWPMAWPKSAKRVHEDRIRFGVVPKPVVKAAKKVAARVIDEAQEEQADPVAVLEQRRAHFDAELKQALSHLPTAPQWADTFSLQIRIQIEAAQQRRRRQRDEEDMLLMLL